MPALATRMSTGPSAASTSPNAPLDLLRIGHVTPHPEHAPGHLTAAVGGRHTVACTNQPLGNSPPYALAAAGDQGHPGRSFPRDFVGKVGAGCSHEGHAIETDHASRRGVG